MQCIIGFTMFMINFIPFIYLPLKPRAFCHRYHLGQSRQRQVVISQCISIRSNGMMDSFMVRYNHYSQSVIRSQQLGKEGGTRKSDALCFAWSIRLEQIFSCHTHTHMYITIATMFLPHLGGKYGLKFSAKPND